MVIYESVTQGAAWVGTNMQIINLIKSRTGGLNWKIMSFTPFCIDPLSNLYSMGLDVEGLLY